MELISVMFLIKNRLYNRHIDVLYYTKFYLVNEFHFGFIQEWF
jgi:hypothetical protein